jgi:hypothetical protein
MTGHQGRLAGILLTLPVCLALFACGGSSSSSGGSPLPPPPAQLTITDNPILPGTLINQGYSVTLHASNGTGTLSWSIAQLSPTALFVTGLTMDPASGVLSGTVAWGGGTAGFIATVKDSASPPHTATKSFTITAYSPMQSPTPQSFTIREYGDVYPFFTITPQGGVPPFTFTITGGAFPPGLRIDSNGMVRGSAIARGNFVSTVTIQDSYTPPEVVPAQISFSVLAPNLSLASSLPQSIPLNRPFSGRLVAVGGVPPYHFSLSSGSVPPGLGPIDPNAGTLSGIPSTLGNSFFSVNVTDSDTPPSTTGNNYSVNVVNPIGRNDTVATATPVGNGSFQASISPYIDPPGNAPLPGDNDYYKIVSVSGATVHVQTQAALSFSGNVLDTVMEIVDGNGARLTTCRQPGVTTTTFNSSCINDDIGGTPYSLDSALDFQVPGAPSTPTTFYVHVLDWRGDARPDMIYYLNVSGVSPPMSITPSSLLPGTRGLNYSQQLIAQNAVGNISWTLTSGTVPAGLNLSSSGLISGIPTTDGTSSFTVQASDGSSPPQVVSAPETIRIVEPVKITSPAVWPDACLNQPYTFAVQTTGGAPPFAWSFRSNGWVGIFLNDSTGVFSGSAGLTGTYMGTVGVTDATGNGDFQNVTLTVKQCP